MNRHFIHRHRHEIIGVRHLACVGVERKYHIKVMLVRHVSTPRTLEQLPGEATGKMRGHLCKVEDTQTTDKVPRIGIVLDVADEVPRRPAIDAGGVDEVVGGSSEGVDLKFVGVFLKEVADNLVDNEGTLYPTLAVQDQDDFVVFWVFEGPFDEGITISCVLCVVEEGTPDEALDEIKENPITDDAMMVLVVDVL